ncbi:MAG: permease [Armatimonadota bacterium]
MDKKKKKVDINMLMPTIIMGVLAAILLAVGYFKGQGHHVGGLKYAVSMSLQMLPLLFFALVVGGMVQLLIPQELLLKWVGTESGLKGIFFGAIAGGLCPGGPFINLPIAAGFLAAGASIGTIVAFLTGWSLWAVARIPLEVGILGWRFVVIRLVCTLIFPPIAGIIAQALFSGFKVQ